MEQNELRAYEARCTQEEMPRCRARCPLHLDVRAFTGLMRDGNPSAARAVLERHLPVPDILCRICDHPCQDVGLRKDLGGAIRVGALERACVEQTPPTGRGLLRSPRDRQTAVLGAGLAGLAAAWDLAGKAWPVTLYHTEDDPLAALGRDFPGSVADGEQERLEKRGIIFERTELNANLLSRLRDGSIAVFVDLSRAPALLPSGASPDPAAGSLGDDFGLCCGGEGTSAVMAAYEGRRGALTLERWLTGASVSAGREKDGPCETRLFTPLEGIAPEAPAEDPKTEAGRCLQCQCLACVRECAYLARHKGYPKIYARQIYNNAAIVKGQHTANKLINTCALCGQCTELCPERFSMADLCLAARKSMVERGSMPAPAHEFALEDMAASNGPDCAFARAAPERASAGHVFFPGCQLAGARVEQVLAAFRHLQETLPGGIGLWSRCCGIPARWAGRQALYDEMLAELRREWESLGKPRIIAACSSCLRVFNDLPDIPAISLWEVLAAEAPPKAANLELAALRLHDPCTARHDAAWQKAVRSLLAQAGVKYTEPSLNAKKTACCGYGGLASAADIDTGDAMARHRLEQLDGPALVACAMCAERFKAIDGQAWHMLDLFFPDPAINPAGREPGLSARRANRALLRRRALAEIYGETPKTDGASALSLRIPPEVLEHMERRHILRQDVERAIRAAEASGQYFCDKQSGRVLAAWRPAFVTYWVEYSRDGNGFILHDAYSHRMQVPMARAKE